MDCGGEILFKRHPRRSTAWAPTSAGEGIGRAFGLHQKRFHPLVPTRPDATHIRSALRAGRTPARIFLARSLAPFGAAIVRHGFAFLHAAQLYVTWLWPACLMIWQISWVVGNLRRLLIVLALHPWKCLRITYSFNRSGSALTRFHGFPSSNVNPSNAVALRLELRLCGSTLNAVAIGRPIGFPSRWLGASVLALLMSAPARSAPGTTN